MTRPGSYRPFAGFSGSAAGTFFSGKSRTAIRLAGYLSLLIFLSLSPAIAQDDDWNNVEGVSHIRVLVDTKDIALQPDPYPVLLQLSSENSCGIFDQLSSNSDRKKMAVYSPEGTQYEVEIESWETETEPKSARIWVYVPRINACCKEIVLRLYYDSSKDDNVHVADITEPESGNYIDSEKVEYICPATGEYAVNTLRANGRTASGDSVTLDWSGYVEPETEGFDQYNIYKSESLFSTVTEDTSVFGTVLKGQYAFTVSGLTAGTRYYFAVVPATADVNNTPLSGMVTPVSAIPESSAGTSTSVSANITEDEHWTLCHSPYIINSSISVAEGVTLTIDPGVIVKFNLSTFLNISGTIDAQGTFDAPIYFTSIRDDSVGGDTDGNTTSPARSNWGGLRLATYSKENILKNITVRYPGSNCSDGLLIQTANIIINNVKIENGYRGILVKNASPMISGVTVINNSDAGFYLYNADNAIVAGNTIIGNGNGIYLYPYGDNRSDKVKISDNTIIGNSTGISSAGSIDLVLDNNIITDCQTGIRITGKPAVIRNNTISGSTQNMILMDGGSLESDITVESRPTGNNRNYISVSAGEITADTLVTWPHNDKVDYVITGAVTVTSGTILDVPKGTVIKFDTEGRITVSGTLKAEGTLAEPIYFTSLKDDAVNDMDTNGDYTASSPAAGNWKGLAFDSSSTGNTIKNTTIRYAGIYPCLQISTFDISTEEVVVEESSYGVEVNFTSSSNQSGLFTLSGITVKNNSNYGFYLNNTAADIDIQMTGNIIIGNATGIQITGKAAIIKENTFRDCTGNTIVLNGSSIKSVITGNTLENVKKEFISVSGGTITESITWKSEENTDMISDLPYVITGGLTVSSNTTMTIRKGTIIKFDSAGSMTIAGTLKAIGTPEEIIYFTSLKDDTIGGDTNTDSSESKPNKGNWHCLYFTTSSIANEMDYTELRYGGYAYNNDPLNNQLLSVYTSELTISNSVIKESGVYGIYIYNASPIIENVEVANNGSTGIYLVNSGTSLTSSGINIHDNSKFGIFVKDSNDILIENLTISGNGTGISFQDCNNIQVIGNTFTNNGIGISVSGKPATITGNTITGCTGNTIILDGGALESPITGNTLTEGNKRNYISVSGGNISAASPETSSVIWPQGNNDLDYVVIGNVTVGSGTTLTIPKGTIIKFEGGSLTVDGTLKALGTPEEIIYFTSLKDDSIGGDTNTDDSASSPQKGDWDCLYFTPVSIASEVDHAEFRYGGQSANLGVLKNKNVYICSSDITISNTIIRESKTCGIYIENASPVIKNIEVIDNTGYNIIYHPHFSGHGVVIKNCSNIQFENVVAHSNDIGILITNCDNTQLIGKANIYNNETGISIKNSNNIQFSGSSIWGNRGSGILLDNTSSANITGNEISTNLTNGIEITNNSTAVISNNRIFMNRQYGVKNSTGTDVDASYNWWGDDSGPYLNAISDNVIYSSNDALAIIFSYQNFNSSMNDADSDSTSGSETLLPAIIRGSTSDEWDSYYKRPERTAVMDPEKVQLKYNNLDSEAYYKIRVTYFNYDSGGGKQKLKDGNDHVIHEDIVTTSTPAQYEFIIPKSSYDVGGSLTLNFINSLYNEEDPSSSRAAISEIWLMQISSDEANVPTITDVDPANGSFLNFSPEAVTITFTSSDSGLNAENSIFSVNEITGDRTLSGNQFIFTPTPASQLVDAEYTIHVRLEDNKGVQGDDTYYHFTVDTKEPAAPVVDYPLVSSVHNPNQTITGTREAYAAILLNDKEIVGHTEETTWSCSVELLEGENILSFRAKDRAGNESNESADISITFDNTAPAAVDTVDVTTRLDGTSVRLDWSSYDETIQGDIKSYSVYAETSDFDKIDGLAKSATVNAGNFTCTVRNLERNTEYYFAVVATDKAGNTGGVHTFSGTPVDKISPSRVTGLKVESHADSLIFSWDAVTAYDLKGYIFSFNGEPESFLEKSETRSIEKTGLDPATQYSFSIVAVDNDGNKSNEVAINGVTFLPNPLNVAAIPLDSGTRLSWDAVEHPEYLEKYNIYQSTEEISDVTNMTPVKDTSDRTILIDNLVNDTPYYFAVTSVNISGGENKEVSSIPATPKTDTGSPVISGIQIDGKGIKDGYTLFDSATLTFKAEDDTELYTVNIYLDDVSYVVSPDLSGSPAYYRYELVDMGPGSHTLKIEATDIYGHQSSKEYQIVMSNKLPFGCFNDCIETE